jgi:hypothetical protein
MISSIKYSSYGPVIMFGLCSEIFQQVKQNTCSYGPEGQIVFSQGAGYSTCSLQIPGTHQTFAIA